MLTTPTETADARRALGRCLAAMRRAAGLKQVQLAVSTQYSRSTVANVETGRQWVARDFWYRCDRALGSPGTLALEYDQVERSARYGTASIVGIGGEVGHRLMGTGSGCLVGLADVGRDSTVEASAGRFYPGASIETRAYPAIEEDGVLVQVPPGHASDPFPPRARRGLLIGVVSTADGTRAYGMDTRRVRQQSRGAVVNTPLVLARAHLLDQFTSAVLWAVMNLDEALLDDDAALAEARHGCVAYESLAASTASLDLVHDLSPVSHHWLGSAFCAGHVLRHLAALTDTPQFWTTEECGEEASAWLLFGHKLEYLDRLAQRFAGSASPMRRVFHVPEAAVAGSSVPERVLLLLAAALMESLGVQIALVAEGDYRGLPGFVLDRSGRMVLANWVRAEGVWHVDLVDRRATVRDHAEAIGHARAHSAICADAPGQRLRRLADYLGLDWPWLIRRCAECGACGLAGLAQPRSRLLRLDGLERACRYVGSLPLHDR